MEYGITPKPSTLGNPTSNAILERIYHVLGNLVRTYNITKNYVDEYDPWSGILAASEFVIHLTTNRLKYYSPGQLVVGRDKILLTKHKVDWEIKTISVKIENELTTTIKLEINSCPMITLHVHTKYYIRAHL